MTLAHVALRRLSPQLLALFGAMLGFFVGSVLRVRRRHVEQSMQNARIDPELAPLFYRSIGRTVMEILAGRTEIVDIDRRALRLVEKGAVIAATHTGNFELVGWAAAKKLRLLAVAKVQSVGMVDRFLRRRRAAHGLSTHAPKGAMRAALDHLKTGGSVIMPIDQVPDRAEHAVVAPFLDRLAFVDRAPAVLAKRANVPLVVVAAHRTEDGRQRVRVLDVIEPQRVCRATVRATEALERFVRAHPTEWLWMHRRWKTPPARRRSPGYLQ
jgi:KDO2-lipid IV(A) lauroyltransferase